MTEEPEQLEPLTGWNVPGVGEADPAPLSIRAGQALVLVGANGSGKSALSYWMSVRTKASGVPVTRVIAHRRVWLESSGADMTTSQRTQNESTFAAYDSQADSRTKVVADQLRPAKVLYDLHARVNLRNAKAAERYDQGERAAPDDGVERSILSRIEAVFAAANLNLRFRVTDMGGFDAVNSTDNSYPISQMSDGEKGAFLLASEALLSPPGSVLLIDEPERHLHRSISSEFIVALMQERPDCGFVLYTHDLDLIGKLDPTLTTVCTVVRASWGDVEATGWELRVEPGPPNVPDSVRNAILGGRTRLLFVEGEISSLDFPLYRLLFPERTVVPCGGSDEVKRAVTGLEESEAFHWVDGRGVLDGDARSADEVAALAAKKILVLPVNEVENLYYLSWIVDAVATHQGTTLDLSGADMAIAARAQALASLKDQDIEHLAGENAGKILRQQAMAALPKAADLITCGPTIPLVLASSYEDQAKDLRRCIADGDYDAVVQQFSVRSSYFLSTLAKHLHFQNHSDYERAVRARLSTNPPLLAKLQATVGGLPE